MQQRTSVRTCNLLFQGVQAPCPGAETAEHIERDAAVVQKSAWRERGGDQGSTPGVRIVRISAGKCGEGVVQKLSVEENKQIVGKRRAWLLRGSANVRTD